MAGPVGIKLAVNVLEALAKQMQEKKSWPVNIMGEIADGEFEDAYVHDGYVTVTLRIPPRLASKLIFIKKKAVFLEGENQVITVAHDMRMPDVEHDNKDS